jgi:diadenosine tetraphosphatase ApaH/serine/threonine PP2A family protein phosphatase
MILKADLPNPGSSPPGYIPEDWTSRQEAFYRRREESNKKDYTGKQWTKELIEFFWTHGNTLWKDRCASAHAPDEDSPNSNVRLRQAAQHRVQMACRYAPLLAHDRQILEVPLEERLQTLPHYGQDYATRYYQSAATPVNK